MPVDRSALPPPGPQPSFRFPTFHKHTLPTGLRVWSVAHRGLPVVTLVLIIPAGAAADPVAAPGLAALTADLLDEGSVDRPGVELHEALGRIGAQFDIEVGHDTTVVTLTCLVRFLETAAALLAEIATRPRFDPDECARARDLRLSRLLQLRQVPAAIADRAFVEQVYGGHPYGHLPIGTEAALRAVTGSDVARFHRDTMQSVPWTVLAVGNAPQGLLTGAVAHAFGEHSSTRHDLAPAVPDPDPTGMRLALIDRPGAVQSELRIGQAAAARRTPDYHTLLVLNMILGGQFVSRLNMKLREERGYTYGVRTSFDCRQGRGPFQVQTSVQTDATADAIRAVLDELRAIGGERPAAPDELALGRAALTRGFPRSFETAGQIARALLPVALYGLPDDYYTEFVPRVQAVDAERVTSAGRRYFHPDRWVIVVVGSRAKVLGDLRALGLGEPVELELA